MAFDPILDEAFLGAEAAHFCRFLLDDTFIIKEGTVVLCIGNFHKVRDPLIVPKRHAPLNPMLSKRLNLYLIEIHCGVVADAGILRT